MEEELKAQITQEMETKWWSVFEKQAMYVGNKTYSIGGLYSNDTRELFLMFIAQQEFNTVFN